MVPFGSSWEQLGTFSGINSSRMGRGFSRSFAARISNYRAADPIPQGNGDIHVPLLHQAWVVVNSVVTCQPLNEGQATDEAVLGEMIGQVEPLVAAT